MKGLSIVYTIIGLLLVVLLSGCEFEMFPTQAGWDFIPSGIDDIDDSEGPLRAFPSAEGFGAHTPGGRGGQVLVVTNLDDNGPGSLREALNTSGPRIVVFRVSGTIVLESELEIGEPYVTIAGQTAPGHGICLSGAQLTIETHDVIVRYLRVRPGDINPIAQWDGISIRDENIIIDHCSMSWSIDEVLSPTRYSDNITIQWCIISEPLHDSYHDKGPHGYAFLICTNNDCRISVHHNLFAHGYRRFPASGTYNNATLLLDFRNNIIYNWGDKCGYGWGDRYPLYMNVIGNYYQAGLDTEADEYDIAFDGANSEHYIYQGGNIMNGQDSDWDMIREAYTELNSELQIEEIYRVGANDVYEAYDRVLHSAGAILPRRDEVDERVVQSVYNRTGQIIDSQYEVGGWPELHNETPPADTDLDGMPDSWEIEHNLDPEDSSDASGTDLSDVGYTNIEVYINSLAYISGIRIY